MGVIEGESVSGREGGRGSEGERECGRESVRERVREREGVNIEHRNTVKRNRERERERET